MAVKGVWAGPGPLARPPGGFPDFSSIRAQLRKSPFSGRNRHPSMPVVHAAGAQPGAGRHADAGGVAPGAGGEGAGVRGAGAARLPAAPCVAISTPAAARHATPPTFRHRTRRRAMPVLPRVKPARAVRPAFAIVARRDAGPLRPHAARRPDRSGGAAERRRSEAESLINSGGELVGSYDWGTRRMAYEIDHRPEADYRLYQFQGDNALLDRLNQRLRILDGVLRFRIIKIKPGQPLPRRPTSRPCAGARSARRRTRRWPRARRPTRRADEVAGRRAPGGSPAARQPTRRRLLAEPAAEAPPAEAARRAGRRHRSGSSAPPASEADRARADAGRARRPSDRAGAASLPERRRPP